MQEQKKELKQLTFLYDWLKIARKPKQSLTADIKMLFDLISIPISQSEISILQKSIDPKNQKHCLQKQDFLTCFMVQEQCRKPKQKQLVKAFKYILNDQQTMTRQQLQQCFKEEGIDTTTTELIMKQIGQFQDQNGNFDYKSFAASIY